jgi:hypothetical protein
MEEKNCEEAKTKRQRTAALKGAARASVWRLFVTQRLDGIEFGGFEGGE